MHEDAFKTIRRRTSAETKIRGSRFIAVAAPVASEEEAETAITAVCLREHAANHHCSAFRIGPADELFRYNDDGEPAGTAGPPILRQIDGRGLTNVLVVVTRYFGGTKLGTGGLMRAYSDAAALALDAADIVIEVIFDRVSVSFAYDDTAPAMHAIDAIGARVVDSAYSDRTHLVLEVPKCRIDEFEQAFTNALGGRGTLERMGDRAGSST